MKNGLRSQCLEPTGDWRMVSEPTINRTEPGCAPAGRESRAPGWGLRTRQGFTRRRAGKRTFQGGRGSGAGEPGGAPVPPGRSLGKRAQDPVVWARSTHLAGPEPRNDRRRCRLARVTRWKAVRSTREKCREIRAEAVGRSRVPVSGVKQRGVRRGFAGRRCLHPGFFRFKIEAEINQIMENRKCTDSYINGMT